MKFVCLDIESTGLDPKKEHVIEVAIAIFDHNGILEEWSSLVKPPISIPEFSSRLTGITDEMVKDAPLLSEIAETIKEKVGDFPIFGHFIFFDINFLAEKGIRLYNTQLDTCQLAQVLLWNEPSYALEVLGQKLKISHVGAHRALVDVKANIELYFRLADHIRALTEKEKNALRPILEKSDWSWAPDFLDLLNGKNEKSAKSKAERIPNTILTKSSRHAESHTNLKNLIEKSENLKGPFLFEEPSHTLQDIMDYALSEKASSKGSKSPAEAGLPIALVCSDLRRLPDHPEIGKLKDPSQYLDENRLADYLKKERLNPIESMLALKLVLWLFETENGEKSEIRLVKEEVSEWYNLCCSLEDAPSSFFKKAQETASGKKILALSHLFFLKDRSRSEPLLQWPSRLWIAETEQLLSEIEEAWHIVLSEARFLSDLLALKNENPSHEVILDHLATKISMLFGFLGIVLERQGIPNDPRHPIIIETPQRNSSEWNKVKESARSIEASVAALGDSLKKSPKQVELQRYLTYLAKILQSPGPLLWLTRSREDLPIVHSFPSEPAELFRERVWKGIDDLRLFCHHGDLDDDFFFIKAELGLPDEFLAIKGVNGADRAEGTEALPLPLFLPKTQISNPNQVGNVAEVSHELKSWLPEVQGDAFLLVNSMNTAEQFFYSLKDLAEKEERKLFVQNLGGGMGKILMMSEATRGKNLFVGDDDFLSMLIENDVPLNFLGIQRLPFSHPNDPITKCRSNFYQNSYKDFVLPQAALRFQTLLSLFLGNSWQDKTILVLDPRIKDYEAVFLS